MIDIKYSRGVTIFAAVCAIVFCIVGILGNICLIALLFKMLLNYLNKK